jgi:hypothetical protein
MLCEHSFKHLDFSEQQSRFQLVELIKGKEAITEHEVLFLGEALLLSDVLPLLALN